MQGVLVGHLKWEQMRHAELGSSDVASAQTPRQQNQVAPPTLESPERFAAADILLPPGTPVGR